MVGLIIDLVPKKIKRAKLKLDKDIARAKVGQVSSSVEAGIMKNPLDRNKFQID